MKNVRNCWSCNAVTQDGVCPNCTPPANQPDPKDTSCTLGVGDGSGKLFVHGDYESIKAAQAIVLEREQLRARVAELERVVRVREDVALELKHALITRDQQRGRVEELEAKLNFAHGECSRWRKDYDRLAAELKGRTNTVHELEETLVRTWDERDAYKRAKAENDERFMIERDEARAECQSHLNYAKHLQSELGDTAEALSDSRAAIQRLEAAAARMRALLKDLADEAEYPQPCTLDGAPPCRFHEALAETDAGTLGLAVIEAAREAAEADPLGEDYGTYHARLRKALDAWSRGTAIPENASHEPGDTAQKGEKSEESGRDGDGN